MAKQRVKLGSTMYSKLIGLKGRDMVGAMVAIYGPRTSLVYFNHKLKQVDELWITSKNYRCISKIETEGKEVWAPGVSKIQIKETTKLFAPGNLRATTENKGYKEVVDFWWNSGYTLRYTGAMVPDIFQIFIKGEGIFSNMISPKHPAKLRYLYEIAPFAFLMEVAGGKSTDGVKSVLDRIIDGYEIKGQVAVGSKTEIDRIEACLKKYA